MDEIESVKMFLTKLSNYGLALCRIAEEENITAEEAQRIAREALK